MSRLVKSKRGAPAKKAAAMKIKSKGGSRKASAASKARTSGS